MKRVVITGGTGFIGANLARRILNEGHELHLLVREGYKDWRIRDLTDGIQFHKVDLRDTQKIAVLVKQIRPDWIFHLAVYGAYPFQTNVREMVETNVVGTASLVEACLKTGFDAFVNAGTSVEYGIKDHAPGEDEYLEPNSDYAVTKASATLFCRYTAQKHRVYIPTLRLYSVYGPYEEPTRLIPTLIRHGLKGKLPPLVNPNVAHDYVFIEDLIDAYVLTAQKQLKEFGAIFNVGTSIQTTLRQVVNLAKREMQIKEKPRWGLMKNRKWDTRTWVANISKITRVLGWRPKFSFEKGFCVTKDWLLKSHE